MTDQLRGGATAGGYPIVTKKEVPVTFRINGANIEYSMDGGATWTTVSINHSHPYLPLSGGTLAGILTAQSNTSYTTRQVRNIIIATTDPVLANMQNGDIWIKV